MNFRKEEKLISQRGTKNLNYRCAKCQQPNSQKAAKPHLCVS